MGLPTMTSKGQVTIPIEYRKRLHIKPKDKLVFAIDGDHLIVHPLHGDILGLKGIFRHAVKGPIDFRKLREEAEEGMADEALERGRIRKPGSR